MSLNIMDLGSLEFQQLIGQKGKDYEIHAKVQPKPAAARSRKVHFDRITVLRLGKVTLKIIIRLTDRKRQRQATSILQAKKFLIVVLARG